MLTVNDIISRLKTLDWSTEDREVNTQHSRKAAYLVNKKYNKYAVPPIYAEKIVQEEGLSLSYRHLTPPYIAAFNRKEKMIILTDDRELLKKWGNFALAHALGHWYLHDNQIDYFSSASLGKHASREDQEANHFASHLLMPKKLMQEWQWLPKQLFTSAFNVPTEGMTFRFSTV
ncbi:MAG: ImmA/IrrE family metallo-endopeptidase [Patescibacteria group bacterium]